MSVLSSYVQHPFARPLPYVPLALLILVFAPACGGGGAATGGAHSPGPSTVQATVPEVAQCREGSLQPCQEPPAPRTQQAASQAQQLAADTQIKTPSGATLTAVKGWFLTRRQGLLLLEDPDRALQLAIIERREAAGEQAITAAWKVFDPQFARPIRQRMDPPAKGGWDAIVRVVYDLPSREERSIVAVARQKGEIWYVALMNGTDAAFERRAGQLRVAFESLEPPGLKKESFGGKKAQLLDADRLRAFASFAEESRQLVGLPGLAISLIQDSKVVFEQGFGVRALGAKAPITPETLFLIGSNTKSMTSLLMAVLVDQGKLRWDTPVTEIMPRFALGDAEATRQLTLRHTVCACTGLPRQDMEFIFQYRGITPEQRLAELKAMKPTTHFGETFQYSNPLVSAGGYLAAHVLFPRKPLGPAYDRAMDQLVFQPLGMKSTTFAFPRALRQDHATGHGINYDLSYVPLPLKNEGWIPAIRPAGGAWSNLRDMSRYVLLHLLGGKTPEGKRIVSEKNLLERYRPQTRISDSESYGLALINEKKYEIQIITHGGGTAGFITQMLWLPAHGVGAVFLTNGNAGSVVTRALKRKLLEILFDGRDEARPTLAAEWKIISEAMAKERSMIDFRPSKAWLSRFVGTYTNPSLGPVTIRLQGNKGTFDAGEWSSHLGQKKEVDGTLKLMLVDPPWNDMSFLPEEQNGRMTLLFSTNQQKYLFVRAR